MWENDGSQGQERKGAKTVWGLAGHWKDTFFCSERNQEPLVAFTRRVTLFDLYFNRMVLAAPGPMTLTASRKDKRQQWLGSRY